MDLTNKIFPSYNPLYYGDDDCYKIAADENGEIVLIKDLITLCLSKPSCPDESCLEYERSLYELVNILSDLQGGEYYYEEELNHLLESANDLINYINSFTDVLNLPFINEDNIISPDIIYDSQDKIVMNHLERWYRPKFNDYFKVLFKSGDITNAAYCYPISKVIDEISEDSYFVLLDEIDFCDKKYPSISDKIDYNLPANIKFIEKFYSDLIGADKKSIFIDLNKAEYSPEEINILIGNVNGKNKIEFNNSIIELYGMIGSAHICQTIQKGNNSFENLINEAKFKFPTNKYNCVIKKNNIGLKADWEFEDLAKDGLITEEFADLKYTGNSIYNASHFNILIKTMRKLKGLPPIDFNKRYVILNY